MQEQASQDRPKREPGILVSLLQTAKQQLFGERPDRHWRAYTRSGKIVVIDGTEVVGVIDPKQVPDR